MVSDSHALFSPHRPAVSQLPTLGESFLGLCIRLNFMWCIVRGQGPVEANGLEILGYAHTQKRTERKGMSICEIWYAQDPYNQT